ncbi:MAG: glycosyltransferase family 9 protein [Verrucomicrobiaceae bacterium]
MSGSNLPDLTQFASALILKPSSLGDIIHTLPAVRCLKRSFPHLSLRWLCNPEWMPLLEGNPDISEIIPFPRGQFRGPLSMPRLFQWVRSFNHAPRELPEVALDFQGLFRSAVLSVLRGAEPVVGLSDARELAPLLYRHVIPVNAKAHAVDRYLSMSAAFGADASPENIEFSLPIGEPVPSGATFPEEFILLHPFSRGRGKSLDVESIRSLCECLAPRTVVIAGRMDEPLPLKAPHVISLLNETSLLQLIWLIRRARAIVSVDSGPMHIAAAIQPERTLGIHTWSDPRRVGPYDPRAWAWKAGRIAHRQDFSDQDARAKSVLFTSGVRRIADFVLQTCF